MNWNPRRFTFVFIAICVGLVFSGCGGGTSASRLTHLTVAPASASVVAGGTQQFTATGLFGDGSTQDETAAVTWTSSNSAVATVVSGGVATGVAAGTANITASLFGVTSNAAVLTVTASSTLVSITVTPALPTVNIGATQQFTATGTYSHPSGPNTTQDITAQVTWASATTAAATISASGLATGVATGTSVVSAMLSGITGQTLLTVTPVNVLISIAVTPAFPTIAAGATQQFTATGTYAHSGANTTQDITGQVTWASATPAAATIDASGLATGVANGASVISATLSGITGQTTLTIGTPIVVGLQVTPTAGSTAAIGTTVVFKALELLSDGTTQALPLGVTIAWASNAPATATIPANSRVAQAVGVGAAVISATESGTACPGPAACTGSATINVVAAQARFAYIASVNGFVIDAYSVNAGTGVFTPNGTPSAIQPQQVVVHPSGHFLYVIDGTSYLEVFSVDSTTGAVTPSTGGGGGLFAPVQAGNSGISKEIIDRTGHFLYVVSQANHDTSQNPLPDTLYGFTINQTTGALTAMAGNPFMVNLNSPQDVQIAHQSGAANDYLYVINSGDNSVAGFSIDPTTGVPTSLGATFATGTTPLNSTIDPTGTHLYVPNSGDGTVSVYSIATTGLLTQVGTATVITDGTTPADTVYNVAVDPSDAHLYVVDNPTAVGAIYGFNIGANGAIGTSIGLRIATGDTPTGIVIDPTGTLLAVDNNFDNTISPYAIGTGGVLTTYPIVTTNDAPEYLTFYIAAAGQ
jgi:6-phosphogluconolactonase (cycloisomerase 2 family)